LKKTAAIYHSSPAAKTIPIVLVSGLFLVPFFRKIFPSSQIACR